MHQDILANDGCRLWTAQSGEGVPLVFCHGGPGLWDYFDTVAAAIGDLARTVRWDQRGCGRSERRGPYTVARSVADLEAIREFFGAARMTLLGHSWGALLALLYALDHPGRVNRLVYVSGTGIDPEHTWKPTFRHNFERRLGTAASRWHELHSRARTPAEDRELAILQWSVDFVGPDTARDQAERLGTPWLGIGHECADNINIEVTQYLQDHDMPVLCRSLAVPTLIIAGDQDLRPRWAVDSLARALPDVQRVTLVGAGHIPWAEDPQGFLGATRRFLSYTIA